MTETQDKNNIKLQKKNDKMNKTIPIFLILIFTSITVFSQSKPISIIPFTLEKNSIYLYCKVNDVDSLKFLFDTGADGSVINESVKNKVNLKIDGESLNIGSNGSNIVELSSSNTVTIGDLIQNNVSLTIIPFGTTAFDGIIGTDLMKNYVIEIDYEKKELRFFSPKTYNNDLSLYKKSKLYFPSNYLSIKSSITVNGKKFKGYFGLDTGADDVLTLASPFSQKYKLLEKTTTIGASISQGSDGSTYEAPLVIIPEIRFSDYRFYRVFTSLPNSSEGGNATKDKAGFYGNLFLKRFDIVLDIPNKFIYFKPNNNLYTDL